jgi:hypothetical protein
MIWHLVIFMYIQYIYLFCSFQRTIVVPREIPLILWNQEFYYHIHKSRHLLPSWARPIQSTSSWLSYVRSILILPSHLHLGVPRSLSFRFPHQNPVHTSPPPFMTWHAHLNLLQRGVHRFLRWVPSELAYLILLFVADNNSLSLLVTIKRMQNYFS